MAGVLLFALLLSACNGSEPDRVDGGDASPDPTHGEGPTPVGSPSTATVEAGGFPRGAGDTALLVDVRLGTHDGFDRVVLEFENRAPSSYRIAYVDAPVREDFSGNEVDVQGDAFLEVRASPAAGFDPRSDDARQTYTGPRRLSPADTEVVREAVRVGDFEGQLAWVTGVSGRMPFGVTTLEEPPRLVIDILATGRSDRAEDLGNECVFTESGWEVTVPYPSAWVANDEANTDTGTVPACRIFDARDAEPPRAHELNAFGFLLHVDAVDFADADAPPLDAERVAAEMLTVDGRPALRHEDRLTETGIRGPAGARVTTYVVDLDGAILVARTHEVADLDYEHNREVLDAVMRQMGLRRAG